MPFMKPYMVKLLREQFPPGTRIRLDSMMNDPQPIPKGMTGTVQGIDDAGQLLMEWDNGRGLSLVPGEDDFTVVKPQKLKLYMPLALGYYEKNDWGDYEDEELTLSDDDAVGYADTITGALERESKFLDTPRGFMEYYNRSDGVDAKVQSLHFKAEARNGKLWGVAECMVSGELTGEELDNLKVDKPVTGLERAWSSMRSVLAIWNCMPISGSQSIGAFKPSRNASLQSWQKVCQNSVFPRCPVPAH